jgi:competence protein ComK
MEKRPNYLMNEKTVLLSSEYDQNGKFITKVIEGKEVFLVDLSPVKLIDKSLINYGSSFKGALESSKDLLHPMKTYPIKISRSLDIWIFPAKSYDNEKSIWFVLNHINDYQAKGTEHTEVFLSCGHTIKIDMKLRTFRTKLHNARELREQILQNYKNSMTISYEPEKGFYIVEDKKGYKYNSLDKEINVDNE